MRQIILFIFAFVISSAYGQDKKLPDTTATKQSKTASVTAIFHKANATKDGYYFGGYVVELDPERSEELDGKKLKITGRLYIEKGLGAYDQKTGQVQGRVRDTKHITSPKIKIIGTRH